MLSLCDIYLGLEIIIHPELSHRAAASFAPHTQSHFKHTPPAGPSTQPLAVQSTVIMAQIPMISVPLKATNEIDWIHPLKHYIQNTYGDDPERYAEECATLNRLRQDMRGAGKDSTAGRDLLYRYYGQLELLDLRFPVDEQHIKISFTWCVASVKSHLRPNPTDC